MGILETEHRSLNLAAYDARYLKLDCSNDPLTGDLTLHDTLTALTLPGFSTNSIPYIGTSGVLSQDNSNLTFTPGTDTLYAYLVATTGLNISGWTTASIPFMAATGYLTEDTDFNFVTGTNMLNVPNITANNGVIQVNLNDLTGFKQHNIAGAVFKEIGMGVNTTTGYTFIQSTADDPVLGNLPLTFWIGNTRAWTLGTDFSLKSGADGTLAYNFTTAGHITIDSDSSKLYLGADQDAEIYHTGSNLMIDNNTGDIYISATGGDISFSGDSIANVHDFGMGTTAGDAGVFTMMMGAQTGDPTFSVTMASDATGNTTIALTGDLTITPTGGEIYCGSSNVSTTGTLGAGAITGTSVTTPLISTTAANLSITPASTYGIDWTTGNIIYVPLTGDIGTYITNATAGDTLILAAGTYTITAGITFNKLLHIQGQGEGITTVTCATDAGDMFTMSVANSMLSDMTISQSGALATTGKTSVTASAAIVLKNIDFTHTVSGAINPAVVKLTSTTGTNIVKNCKITASGAVQSHYGITKSGASGLNIIDCSFAESGSTNVNCCLYSSAGTVNIYNSNLTSTSAVAYGTIYSDGTTAINIYNSVLSSNTSPDVRRGAGTLTLYNTDLVHNTTTGTITYAGTIVSAQGYFGDKVIFTQTDGNEYIDSLADGFLDLGATTSVRSTNATVFSTAVASLVDSIYLKNTGATGGSGNIGSSIGFASPQGDRRAAIATEQLTADTDQVGFVFYGHSSAVGTDALDILSRLNTNGWQAIEATGIFKIYHATAPTLRLRNAYNDIKGEDVIAMIDFEAQDASTGRIAQQYAQIKALAYDPAGAGSAINGSINEGGSLAFFTALDPVGNTNFGFTERMRIMPSGNVGIGETVPQDTLEVNGTGLFKDKIKLTQDDGNEYIDSDSDGWVNIGATTGVEINAPILNAGSVYSTAGFDCGDAGGWSGLKFNAGTTQLEVWIDGAKIGHFATDGTYTDDV